MLRSRLEGAVKLTAQEEYGLRCLLQVARRAPSTASAPLSIRDVADAEGLSIDYAAKLLRILRQADLVTSERGATGGYRLSQPADTIPLRDVMRALDTPMYSSGFCDAHAGQLDACVHRKGCSMRPLWHALEAAVDQVLTGLYLADLLKDEPFVHAQVTGVDRRTLMEG
jgi:Rrf2 family protein